MSDWFEEIEDSNFREYKKWKAEMERRKQPKVVLPTTTEEWQRDMRIAYNTAIDDFVKLCDEAKMLMFGQYSVDMRDVREIAEQLKGGKK